MAKKKWVTIDGRRVLLKAGSGESKQEPFNEMLVTAINRRLGYSNYVTYDVVDAENIPFSACDDFLDTSTELISARNVRDIYEETG